MKNLEEFKKAIIQNKINLLKYNIIDDDNFCFRGGSIDFQKILDDNNWEFDYDFSDVLLSNEFVNFVKELCEYYNLTYCLYDGSCAPFDNSDGGDWEYPYNFEGSDGRKNIFYDENDIDKSLFKKVPIDKYQYAYIPINDPREEIDDDNLTYWLSGYDSGGPDLFYKEEDGDRWFNWKDYPKISDYDVWIQK